MLTIGIVSIGSDLTHAAKLYHAIVVCCTIPKESGGFGCEKDQDHPPTISVSLLPKNPTETENSFHLTKYLGADFFAVAEIMDEEQMREITGKTGLIVLCLKKGQTLNDFAKEVAKYAFETEITDPVRIARGSFAYPILNQELREFARTISTKKSKIIGAITGAGPIAGAVYYDELASSALPHIGISYTTAPDKNNAILGLGPDFVPAYKEVMRLIDPFVDCHTIACNTAHSKIDDFRSVVQKPFLDIRDATLAFLKDNFSAENKNVILLGTPATMKRRLYHERLAQAGYNIIEPSEEQLDTIYQIIYQVKGNIVNSRGAPFDLDNAKERILAVIRAMRIANLDKTGTTPIPVLLGCTELNVPFTPAEISHYRLISTTSALVETAKSFSKMYDRILRDTEMVEFKEEDSSQKSDSQRSDNSYSGDEERPSSSPSSSISPTFTPLPLPLVGMPLSSFSSLNLGDLVGDLDFEDKKVDVSLLNSDERTALGQILLYKASKKRPRVEELPCVKIVYKRESKDENDSEISGDESSVSHAMRIIRHLISGGEKILVSNIDNKVHITFPEISIIDKHEKITRLRDIVFKDVSGVRFHPNRGYISCDVSPEEVESVKGFVEANKLNFQETGATR